MMNEITTNQARSFTGIYSEGSSKYRITATVRHDDRCGNGHNSFSVTCDIDEKSRNGRWIECGGGADHEAIVKRFPNLAPFIKWHLCSTDGPLHYVANTTYWAKMGNIDNARKTAIWPDATLDQLDDVAALEARLPALLDEFRVAVESLGFTY